MKDKLIEWANAGDAAAMFIVASIFHDEGDEEKATEYLQKSAEANYIDAIKKMAWKDLEGRTVKQDYNKALDYFKIAAIEGEEDAMDAIVDMCEQGQGIPVNDEATLDFVLEIINKYYNEIYLIDRDFFARCHFLGTRRHNECTFQTLQAIERRRIASRIRRIKADKAIN